MFLLGCGFVGFVLLGVVLVDLCSLRGFVYSVAFILLHVSYIVFIFEVVGLLLLVVCGQVGGAVLSSYV
ncbi:hypothetical protein [Ahrensia kielensis]|uniref:hypothetical protein n=1 Tax=Ahrensia kielensis TaxID=76980 RepID=UPI0012E9BA2B|nr:hypothetical protein [Ahrensia kielensis]